MNTQTELAPVRHWTTRNDANHSNRHAECLGVEFFAFPYQSALGKVRNHLAVVADILTAGAERPDGGRGTFRRWSARVELCHPDGRTNMQAGAMFPPREDERNATDADRDAAYRWAAEKLLEGAT